jgi:hypothetical protein
MSCIGQFRNMEACPGDFHPEHPVCAACIDSQIRAALKICDAQQVYDIQNSDERRSHEINP